MKSSYRRSFVYLGLLTAVIMLQGCENPCPANHHWSEKDKMCVPSYTRTGPRG